MPVWCLAWLWLSLPLTVLAQQPADSLTNQQPGVGVFGAVMDIHADTVGVWGDVVFDSANIGGNGILSLRGHSPAEPAGTQRIIAQYSQVQHLHLASTDKTVLLGSLRIEKSLTVATGVFDVSAGKLEQSATCQTRLLHGAHILNLPLWTVQSTNSKTSLENYERLVGLHTAQTICSFFGSAERPHRATYRLPNYQLTEVDKPAPPPKDSECLIPV